MLTCLYTGQAIEDPGMPAAGDVWIDRSGGGVHRILEVVGDKVRYEHVEHGPRFSCGVEWLRKSATRKS